MAKRKPDRIDRAAASIAGLVRREVKRERKAPPAPSVNDELLDACELALEELHGYADAGGSVKAWNICEHLRAVIAKAREAGR